jgi:adenylate kinase
MADETTRTKAQIEADISAARDRLAASVESLFMEVHPRAIAARKVADARLRATDRAKAIKAQQVALVAAAVAGAVAFLVVVRSIVRH